MRLNYLLRASPLLSIILLIILLSFSNQKESAKLRILIWSTPSLSLGSYIAISTGTGFILSYLITNNLAKVFKPLPDKTINYKAEYKQEETNEQTDTSINTFYDNILIERDIKDPLPTINANFRIIGSKKGSNINFINNNNNNNNIDYEDSVELTEKFDEQSDKNDTINEKDQFSNDWNDESYSRW